jgi:adenosine kinase
MSETALRASGAALICGSMAFDTIMVFQDRFRNHILPDKIHMLNVSFLVPQMRREHGGCAGNIAYNLHLLGDTGYPMATVGRDFGPYRECTAFHPGAMQHAHLNEVTAAAGITLGIVAPDGREGMLQHAAQFQKAGIPFIFDPGQGLPLFAGPELIAFIEEASWLAVNEYEWQLVQQKTGWGVAEVIERVNALIVTRGAQGSLIHTKEGEIAIPAAKVKAVVDPTGCGDAYRAGLLHGLLHGLDWTTTGRIASVLGAIKIESRGTQNHHFTPAELTRRLAESYGMA